MNSHEFAKQMILAKLEDYSRRTIFQSLPEVRKLHEILRGSLGCRVDFAEAWGDAGSDDLRQILPDVWRRLFDAAGAPRAELWLNKSDLLRDLQEDILVVDQPPPASSEAIEAARRDLQTAREIFFAAQTAAAQRLLETTTHENPYFEPELLVPGELPAELAEPVDSEGRTGLILKVLERYCRLRPLRGLPGIRGLYQLFKRHLGTHVEFATVCRGYDCFGLQQLPGVFKRLFDSAYRPRAGVWLDEVLDDLSGAILDVNLPFPAPATMELRERLADARDLLALREARPNLQSARFWLDYPTEYWWTETAAAGVAAAAGEGENTIRHGGNP